MAQAGGNGKVVIANLVDLLVHLLSTLDRYAMQMKYVEHNTAQRFGCDAARHVVAGD